jgi:hypothetical protein
MSWLPLHGDQWQSASGTIQLQSPCGRLIEVVHQCYGIYFGVKTFEDLLDNRYFILKTDHMNLTYLIVTLTGKVQRWKLYLQDEDFYLCHVPGKEVHQFVADALKAISQLTSGIKPSWPLLIPDEMLKQIAAVHNSIVGH